jgi:hypothetical protein
MAKKTLIVEIFGIIALSICIGTAAGGGLFLNDFNLIDEGQFAAWANHMLLGKQMYKDIYITYGPFFIYPLYILFKLLGPSLFLIRAYMLVGSMFGLIIALLIMHRLHVRYFIRYFLLGIMILLPVMQVRQGVALLALYLLMVALEKGKYWRYFAVGMAAACSFLVSPDMGICILLIFGVVFTWSAITTRRKLLSVLQSSTAVIFGIASIILPFAAWANYEGWLIAYILTTTDLFSSFSGINLPNGMGFPNLLDNARHVGIKLIVSKEALLYWGLLFYVITTLFIVINSLRQNSVDDTRDISLLVLLGFLMYSILIGRWGIGHFFFILSPMLLIGGYFGTRLHDVNNKKPGNRMVSIGLLLILLFFGLRLLYINHPQISMNLKALASFIQNKPEGATKQQVYLNSVLSFADMYVRGNESVYIISNEPVLYMLMNKPNPTRYDLPYIVITKDKRLEVLSQLIANPPTYIMENTNEWDVDGISNRQRMPEVSTFVDNNYREVKNLGGLRVYRYKSS